MKYLKLFENIDEYHSRIKKTIEEYNQSVNNLRDKKDLKVKSIIEEYKKDIEECLYYLTDNFNCKVDFNIDTRNVVSNFELPTYTINILFKKEELSNFVEECSSALSRLDLNNLQYIVSGYMQSTNVKKAFLYADEDEFIPGDKVMDKIVKFFNSESFTKQFPHVVIVIEISDKFSNNEPNYIGRIGPDLFFR